MTPELIATLAQALSMIERVRQGDNIPDEQLRDQQEIYLKLMETCHER